MSNYFTKTLYHQPTKPTINIHKVKSGEKPISKFKKKTSVIYYSVNISAKMFK